MYVSSGNYPTETWIRGTTAAIRTKLREKRVAPGWRFESADEASVLDEACPYKTEAISDHNGEQENKTPPRGLSKEELVPEGHSNIVFEMYIPEKIRDELRDEYEKTAASSASKNNAGITKLAESHEAMNKMLQEKFVALADTNGLDISTPTLAHRMVGYPPVKKDMPVLLRDNDNSFASVLLFGIERDLVLMDLLVFVMWDLVFVDVFISALLTYLVSHALVCPQPCP